MCLHKYKRFWVTNSHIGTDRIELVYILFIRVLNEILERSSYIPVLKNCSASSRKAPAGRYLNEAELMEQDVLAQLILTEKFYAPASLVVVHCISRRMCIPFCSSVDSWAWNASATIGSEVCTHRSDDDDDDESLHGVNEDKVTFGRWMHDHFVNIVVVECVYGNHRIRRICVIDGEWRCKLPTPTPINNPDHKLLRGSSSPRHVGSHCAHFASRHCNIFLVTM